MFSVEMDTDMKFDYDKLLRYDYTATKLKEKKPPRCRLVSRARWGALPPRPHWRGPYRNKPMKPPVPFVLLCYDTGTPPCRTRKECAYTVRQLQRRHMRNGLPDIAYSFLVGGDGMLYEGRGWSLRPLRLFEKYKDVKSLDIAYIGAYTSVEDDNLTPEMVQAACDLINMGILKKCLVEQDSTIMIDWKKAEGIRVNLIDRPGWGALPPKETRPLPRPIPNVLFFHDTDLAPCHTHGECVRTVQELQQKHMDQGLPDIAYSFLIGGDGTVYEGSGWYNVPCKLGDKYAHLDGLSLDIAYIGKFSEAKRAYPDMARAGINLMNIAVLNNFAKGTFNFIEDIVHSGLVKPIMLKEQG